MTATATATAPTLQAANRVRELLEFGTAVYVEGVSKERFLKFIERAKAAGRPFFVVIWFGSPHEPYQAPPAPP